MTKEFTPHEQALALKELGFDEPCFAYYTVIPEDKIDWFTIPEQGITDKTSFGSSKNYNSKSFEGEGTISAPTFSQAFRWFRKKYKLNSETPYLPNVEKYGIIVSDMTIKPKDLSKNENFKRGVEITNNFAQYDTHEEAELACLKKLIQISTQQHNQTLIK